MGSSSGGRPYLGMEALLPELIAKQGTPTQNISFHDSPVGQFAAGDIGNVTAIFFMAVVDQAYDAVDEIDADEDTRTGGKQFFDHLRGQLIAQTDVVASTAVTAVIIEAFKRVLGA